VTILNPRLELIFRDASASQGSITLNLKPGSTVADADTFLSGGVSAFVALTGATLVATRLTYKVELDPSSAAAEGSTIKRAGVFVWACIDDIHQALVEVPGILDGDLMTSGPGAGVLIDTSISDVIAFMDSLLSNGVTDPFDNEINQLVAAYLQSRV
jgi:hypothetical protein